MTLEELQAFKLGEDHDFELEADEFGNKDLVIVTGLEYVSQSIEIRLMTQRGEYPLDADFGFPVEQAVGIFNRTFISGAIRRALDPDPDIAELLEIEINLGETMRKRGIDARIAARAEDGTVFGVEVQF